MKKLLLTLAAGIVLCSCGSHDPQIAIVPYPNHLETGRGTYRVTDRPVTCDSRTDERTQRAVVGFAARLATVTGGTNPVTVADEVPASGIRFVTDESLPAEGYELNVDGEGIEVRASQFPGFLYALQSLEQLLPAAVYGTEPAPDAAWEVPCVKIADAPRFAYRGMHLDVARHFFSVDEVKRYIDVMAIHKLNTLHWHLTDDQGWRIEIKRYPELTAVGSIRKATVVRKEWGTYDGTPYGGFYTQDEIRDVVKYAADRGVTVIPEIDLPGHMLAALTAYPELGCTGGPYEVWGRWGVADDVLCPGREKTFEFLEGVLTEVMELFPSEYIHIGGDEASKQGWRTCPKCAARMRKEGLKDVDELQSYMIRRIETFLNAKGRRLLGWDEILEGGLAPDATVMSWRGTEGGIAAAAAGHHAVMTPSNYCYLDFCQDDPTTEPVAAAAFLTLEQAYSYDPAPDSLGAQVVPMILGVQGNLWCEHVPTAEHAEHMIWPRLLAVAEVGWSAPERKDYDDFYARALDAVAWLQERGYHPFDQKNAVGPRPESLEPLRCLSTGKTVIYHTPYSPKYAAAGDGSLTDGLRGGWNYGDRRWLGWLDTDVDLVVDLGERQPVRRIAADFMQGFYADIWMPRAVEFSVSDDNEHFTPLATVGNDIPVEFKQDCYREFGWTGQTEARYVRLKARHNGRPGGWIFTDEIIVE